MISGGGDGDQARTDAHARCSRGEVPRSCHGRGCASDIPGQNLSPIRSALAVRGRRFPARPPLRAGRGGAGAPGPGLWGVSARLGARPPSRQDTSQQPDWDPSLPRGLRRPGPRLGSLLAAAGGPITASHTVGERVLGCATDPLGCAHAGPCVDPGRGVRRGRGCTRGGRWRRRPARRRTGLFPGDPGPSSGPPTHTRGVRTDDAPAGGRRGCQQDGGPDPTGTREARQEPVGGTVPGARTTHDTFHPELGSKLPTAFSENLPVPPPRPPAPPAAPPPPGGGRTRLAGS